VSAPNISNTDVWVQKVDNTNTYSSSVTKVDNDTRETAIYNSLRNGNGDIVSVNTINNNAIELHYGDGVFANAASGSYRVWYRVSDNENYRVDRNDVKEKTISIPYTGADKKNYRLVVTLSSTRDFAENFAAESYTSVRRIAPRSYYSQDRMVNAQDYNVLPLSLGTNVVSKVKAVTDGSVYMEDDVISMNLRFNRQNGNATDFIRNEITKAIRHPSLINLFYSVNKTNPDAVIDLSQTPELFDIDPTDPKVIMPRITMTTGIRSGDFIKLVGDSSDNEYWTQMNYSGGAPVSNFDNFEVTDIIPELSGQIETIVRGYRTRLEDTEIQNIKSQKIEVSASSFIIKFIFDGVKWAWEIHDELTDLVPGQDVFLELSYNPGIRDSEAEYVVSFTGKRIVFESNDQVKFFYGNNEMIVDNETNLAERDSLLINYYDVQADSIPMDSIQEDEITIGHAPITNYIQDGNGATFDAVYQYTGANETLEFINGHPGQIVHRSTQHYLVSPLGIEYPVTPELDVNGDVPIIGEEPQYKISFDIADTSGFIGESSEIENDVAVVDSDEYVYPALAVNVETSDAANVTSTSSTVTLSSADLLDTGFKGTPSSSYFSGASDTANFVWVDQNELPAGETIDTALHPMTGVQTEYFTTVNGNMYEFEFPRNDGWGIDLNDNDVKWKQLAYGKIVFDSTTVLTEEGILVRLPNGTFISNDHWDMEVDASTYTITFWTYDPGEGTLLDISIAGVGIADLSTFSVRVEAIADVTYRTSVKVQSYKDVKSYVYDKFITSAGYIDYSKVKVIHMDSEKDPHGILNVFNGEVASYIILEDYSYDNISYERVSNKAIAATETEALPSTAIIWYNPETNVWKRKISGVWTTSFEYGLVNEDGTEIDYNDVNYRVVMGRSYVEDTFMSFRWDHYADIDKRIDPSTSNIIDMYVLTSDPNNFELRKIMESIEDKSAIADHVSYIPVKFKMLFGEYAEAENQAVFKVIAKKGTAYTDSEIKNVVAKKVNEYFNLDNWDFGDQFYFSELAAYLHKELADYISSVIITPKFANGDFKNLLSINCEPHEIFLSVVTSNDVKIISSITNNELTGEY